MKKKNFDDKTNLESKADEVLKYVPLTPEEKKVLKSILNTTWSQQEKKKAYSFMANQFAQLHFLTNLKNKNDDLTERINYIFARLWALEGILEEKRMMPKDYKERIESSRKQLESEYDTAKDIGIEMWEKLKIMAQREKKE